MYNYNLKIYEKWVNNTVNCYKNKIQYKETHIKSTTGGLIQDPNEI